MGAYAAFGLARPQFVSCKQHLPCFFALADMSLCARSFSTFTSSAPSGIIPDLIAAFDMSREVATLQIAIFVAAYCVGPLVRIPSLFTFSFPSDSPLLTCSSGAPSPNA